jgi:Short C-terminal domain
MFGNNKRLENKLRTQGRQAPAEILEAKQTHWVNSRPGGLAEQTDIVWKLRLQVRPADGAEFTAEVKQQFMQFDQPTVGRIVGVLYDPDNHSRVTIDDSDQAHLDGAISEAMSHIENPALADAVGSFVGSIDVEKFRQNPKAYTQQMRDSAREMAAGFGASLDSSVVVSGSQGLPGTGDAPAADAVDQLAKLADLHDRGVVTDQEFQAQKRRLLGEDS